MRTWVLAGLALFALASLTGLLFGRGSGDGPPAVAESAPTERAAAPRLRSTARTDGALPRERRLAGCIQRVLGGQGDWERLLDRLGQADADFREHMGSILAACIAQDADIRVRATRLLHMALGGSGRGGPDFLLLAWKGSKEGEEHPLEVVPIEAVRAVLDSPRASLAARLLLVSQLAGMGPRAAEVLPAVFAMLQRHTDPGRARPGWGSDTLVIFDDQFEYGAYDVAQGLGAVGMAVLPHLTGYLGAAEPRARRFAHGVLEDTPADLNPMLAAWLRSPSPGLRVGVLEYLRGRRTVESEEVLQALRAVISDPTPAVREGVMHMVCRYLPATEADVLGLLQGSDASLRTALLGEIPRHVAHATPALRRAIMDVMARPRPADDEGVIKMAGAIGLNTDPAWREASRLTRGVLQAIARSGRLAEMASGASVCAPAASLWPALGPEAWSVLLGIFGEQDASLQQAAAWVLATLSDPPAGARTVLATWLARNEDHHLAPWIATALTTKAHTEYSDLLLAALRSESWGTRAVAATGVERMGGGEYLTSLAAAAPELGLKSKDVPIGVRVVFHNAIMGACRQDLEAAYAWISHAKRGVHAPARQALLIEEEHALPLMESKWPGASRNQRVAMLDVLAQLSDTTSLCAEMRASFGTSDRTLRVYAARALYVSACDLPDALRTKVGEYLVQASVFIQDGLTEAARSTLLFSSRAAARELLSRALDRANEAQQARIDKLLDILDELEDP